MLFRSVYLHALAFVVCMTATGLVFAGDAAVVTPPEVVRSASIATGTLNAGYLAQLVVGLLVVMLCIIALAWFAKRFGRLQTSPDGNLQMLGGMSMGARERIVLIQVGEKQLLLGVSPGRINTLHVLDEPLVNKLTVNSQPAGGSFAEKLGAVLARGRSL